MKKAGHMLTRIGIVVMAIMLFAALLGCSSKTTSDTTTSDTTTNDTTTDDTADTTTDDTQTDDTVTDDTADSAETDMTVSVLLCDDAGAALAQKTLRVAIDGEEADYQTDDDGGILLAGIKDASQITITYLEQDGDTDGPSVQMTVDMQQDVQESTYEQASETLVVAQDASQVNLQLTLADAQTLTCEVVSGQEA